MGQHVQRFESGFIKAGERFYLVGGRQAPQPVEIFDPATRTWKAGAVSPVTMHHFQPAVYDGKIYVLARSQSGRGEPPLPDVYIYDPRPIAGRKGRPSRRIVSEAALAWPCTMGSSTWWLDTNWATRVDMSSGWIRSIRRPASGTNWPTRRARGPLPGGRADGKMYARREDEPPPPSGTRRTSPFHKSTSTTSHRDRGARCRRPQTYRRSGPARPRRC